MVHFSGKRAILLWMVELSNDRNDNTDFKSVTFPSDHLTLGDLRARFREQFDVPTSTGMYGEFFLPDNVDDDSRPLRHLFDLVSMITSERELVEMETALRDGYVPDAEWLEERELAICELAQLYVRFGVTESPASAMDLVNSVLQIRVARP
jgi:hypothetical protein